MTKTGPELGSAPAIKNAETLSRPLKRAQREAEALRENLHRRKQQARARDTLDKDKPDPS